MSSEMTDRNQALEAKIVALDNLRLKMRDGLSEASRRLYQLGDVQGSKLCHVHLREDIETIRALIATSDATEPAAPGVDEVEKVARAIRDAQFCGLKRDGKIVFCDQCDCHQVARAAIAALTPSPVPESETARLREALEKVREWLDYENSPMGPTETAQYNRLMAKIDAALASGPAPQV